VKRLWPVGVPTERFRYLTPSSRASPDFDTQFACLLIFDTELASFFISKDSLFYFFLSPFYPYPHLARRLPPLPVGTQPPSGGSLRPPSSRGLPSDIGAHRPLRSTPRHRSRHPRSSLPPRVPPTAPASQAHREACRRLRRL